MLSALCSNRGEAYLSVVVARSDPILYIILLYHAAVAISQKDCCVSFCYHSIQSLIGETLQLPLFSLIIGFLALTQDVMFKQHMLHKLGSSGERERKNENN